MVELAEKTITAPSASRQRVAVSSRLYSVEWVAARERFFLRHLGRLARALERDRAHSRPLTIWRKRSPRCSKFSKASKLAQAGESRTTSPGAAAAGGAADRFFQVLAEVQLDASLDRRRQRLGEAPGRGAGQVAGAAALAHRVEQRRVGLALLAAAEDRVDAALEGAQPDGGRGDVGRLGVVDEAHAADLGDLLEPVRDAGKAAQPLAHGVAVDSHRERRGGGGHRVGDVVLAEQPELGDREQRLAVVEDRPLG